MPSPSGIVTAFIDLWEQPEGFPEAVDRFFTEATIYENHGLLTTVGKAEAVAFYRQFSEQTGMRAMKIAVRAIAETGRKVLTERIDYLLGADGEPVMTVPCMGVFEIDGQGRIAVWRDYFDTVANMPPGA
jgi:limonene-1,2-epoxide hydrolase